jgi:hypothetical protein
VIFAARLHIVKNGVAEASEALLAFQKDSAALGGRQGGDGEVWLVKVPSGSLPARVRSSTLANVRGKLVLKVVELSAEQL